MNNSCPQELVSLEEVCRHNLVERVSPIYLSLIQSGMIRKWLIPAQAAGSLWLCLKAILLSGTVYVIARGCVDELILHYLLLRVRNVDDTRMHFVRIPF